MTSDDQGSTQVELRTRLHAFAHTASLETVSAWHAEPVPHVIETVTPEAQPSIVPSLQRV